MTTSHRRYFFSKLRSAGKLTGTIKSAMAKWRERQEKKLAVTPKMTLRMRYERARCPIPLAGQRSRDVENRLCGLYPRRQNWEPAQPSAHGSFVSENDNGRYSSRCGYSRISYTPAIESYSLVFGKRMIYTFDGQKHTIVAPRGYRWERDANGVALVGAAGDYHPTSDDLLQPHAARHCVAQMKKLAAVRRAARDKLRQSLAMVRRAESEGARVCLQDSRRAGNCMAGSLTWAANHGIAPHQHVRPSALAEEAEKNTRVAIVVAAAVRRHRLEMERGYSVLAEHGR